MHHARSPDCIARPGSAGEVATVVRLAGQANTKIALRGSGHNYQAAALRDGGVMVDVSGLDQIEIDVAVLAASSERRILSLGEAKWGVTMGVRHLDRLRRARDLLSVRGYDTTGAWLACYSGSGFDHELRAAAGRDRVLLVDLARLYAD